MQKSNHSRTARAEIHFACLFGVDYELDLMPYWIEHWVSHRLDRYKVFLHRESGVIDPAIIDTFKRAGFDVECLSGPHSNGLLRGCALSNYAANMDANDFLVTADADEYHLINYHDILSTGVSQYAPAKYDIVTGFMVDRYGDSLQACNKDPFDQYCYEEPFTKEILKNFTPPYLRNTAWPFTMRTKILACKAGMESTYAGSHTMKAVPSGARILTDRKVYHFAWRESASKKAAVKTYYSEDNLFELFAGKIPEKNIRHFKELKTSEKCQEIFI